MHITVNNKKIKVLEYTNFIDRLKSFRFYFDEIDFAIKIPKKKTINTYFFCQRVDICVTDKDNKIIKLYQNFKSEQLRFKFKGYNIYYLPLNTAKYLKIDNILKETK